VTQVTLVAVSIVMPLPRFVNYNIVEYLVSLFLTTAAGPIREERLRG
jgi:ABC-type polysaccharide transport system permease subunit